MYTIQITANVRKRGAIGIDYPQTFTIQSKDREPNRGEVVDMFLEQHGYEWELFHIAPRPSNEPLE